MSEQRTQTPTIDTDAFDTLFTLLRDPRRRTIIAVLAACEGEIAVSDLTRAIAAHEHDGSVADVSNAERRRIAVSLHHDHIPRLAASEFVDYDDRRETVAATENLERVAPVLSLVTEDEAVRSIPDTQ